MASMFSCRTLPKVVCEQLPTDVEADCRRAVARGETEAFEPGARKTK